MWAEFCEVFSPNAEIHSTETVNTEEKQTESMGMKFKQIQADIIRYALQYLSEAELLPENGWDEETMSELEKLQNMEFVIEDI